MRLSGRREPSREEEVSVSETVLSLAGEYCGKAILAGGHRLVQHLYLVSVPWREREPVVQAQSADLGLTPERTVDDGKAREISLIALFV